MALRRTSESSALQRHRQDRVAQDVPSASGQKKLRRDGDDAGADEVVATPFLVSPRPPDPSSASAPGVGKRVVA